MDQWNYQPTADFDQDPRQRLRSFPRQPHMLVYAIRALMNVAIRAVLRVYHRLRIEGRENLPRNGSFVMVANHSSHADTAALLAALPLGAIHRAFPAAASDYFFTTLPRVAFSAVVMNAMPFDRKENPKQSLNVCRRLLESDGHVLILFPEGTRTTDGALGPFKPGIGFLIGETHFPVVPCHLEGAFRAWPKGAWIPRPRRLTLRIGKPMTFEAATPCKENAVGIAQALREAVQHLSRPPGV